MKVVKLKMDKIIYLTYQTFPSDTANTLQTIDNAKYIGRKGYEVEIIFPLRSKTSTDDINILKTHYGFNQKLKM